MAELQIKTSPVFEPLLTPSRYKGAYGGRSCVHKDTLLDTPAGQVRIKDFPGGEIWSHHNGKVVKAHAEKPVEHGEEDLYRVVLKDGREIIATAAHKFLTPGGWQPLKNLFFLSEEIMCKEGLIKISSVRRHSRQNYWDLHVPIYNNYLSNGIVNHNSGKCLGRGTVVMRADGHMVAVEDVKLGDQLMGPDSKPRTVLGVNSGVGELYLVRQKLAADYVINADHILALKARHSTSVTLINVKDYLNKDESFKARTSGFKAEVDFPYQPVPVDPYLFGLWLGDGDAARVAFTNMDEEILDYLKEYAQRNGLNVHDTKKPNQRARRIIFSNNWIRRNSILRTFRKANLLKNKHIPDNYLINSKEVRLKVLAGLIDSDGHINDGLSITQKSYRLIKEIKRLADGLGFRSNILPKTSTCNGKKYDCFVVSIGGDINRIPCLVKYKRKKLKSQRYFKGGRRSRIDVESIGIGEYFGFELDGDHLFLLEDGTVTHNSHFFAELAIERCIMSPGIRIVCVREIQKSLKESVKRLLEDKITAMGVGAQFKVLYDSIVTPGQGVIIFQGLVDHTAESIKSLEGFDIGYAEEAQTLTSHSLELFIPTIIRKKGSELWFSWNPRDRNDPVDKLLRGPNIPEGAVVVQSNYRNNNFLTEESESVRRYDRVNNPHRYAHIWDGEYEPQAIGAIWTRDMIERNRVEKAPDLKRILIGVDPPTESGEESDECGLVAVGMGSDQRGYVLQDESKRASPEEWGRAAIAMYDLHEADAIVAEVNQGGDMVRSVLQSIRPGIRVIKVRAKRGKHLRAEPIAALYSLNRISHVGNFPELERQLCLCTAEGYEGNDSPDRMDGMIYPFAELFGKMTRKEIPEGQRPVRASSSYRPHDGLNRGVNRK